jgi:hypothetical protein
VSVLTRRLRSLLIALAVLALSATAALAGRGVLSNQHGQAASQVGQGDGQADESEAPETEGADAPETDTTDAASGEHPDNHGKLVSGAAQSPTPDGFDNHGAYVRTIAQDNAGKPAAATKRAPKSH